MKRVFLLLALLSVMMICGAQKRDVTKFMGIPIDGTYSSFEKKLLKKGFHIVDQSYVSKKVYRGEFNGSEVDLFIVTSGEKVYRVHLSDNKLCTKEEIIDKFNNLCRQFCLSKKYISFFGPYDSICIDRNREYNDIEKEVQSPLFFQGKESDLDEEFFKANAYEFNTGHLKIKITDKDDPVNREALFETYKLKGVWFKITKFKEDMYYITIFYDNLYNLVEDADI